MLYANTSPDEMASPMKGAPNTPASPVANTISKIDIGLIAVTLPPLDSKHPHMQPLGIGWLGRSRVDLVRHCLHCLGC